MKYVFFALVAILLSTPCNAQTPKIDSVFQRLAVEKDDETIVCTVVYDLIIQADAEPQYAIPIGQKLLILSK